MVGGEKGLIFYYLYYTCPRISAVLLCLHIGLSFVQTTCKHILQAGQFICSCGSRKRPGTVGISAIWTSRFSFPF